MKKKILRKKTRLPTFFFAVVFIGLISLVLYYLFFGKDKIPEAYDYYSCIKSGGSILETYPEQCISQDKIVYTRPLSKDELVDLWGNETSSDTSFSTKGACEEGVECRISGCNSEICQSIEEPVFSSICSKSTSITPEAAGLECKCVQNQCTWD